MWQLRVCFCQAACPVHRLGPILAKLSPGQKLFDGITPAKALSTLRQILRAIGLADALDFRTHDLRRGHALDLQLAGAPLHEILTAGDWASPAFMVYMNKYRLERDLVQQAHLQEALSESECDNEG